MLSAEEVRSCWVTVAVASSGLWTQERREPANGSGSGLRQSPGTWAVKLWNEELPACG